MFSHRQRGILKLCQSDHWVLGNLPDQDPSPPIAQFGRAASSNQSWWLRMMEATVFLGKFKAAEMFWYSSPDPCLDTILSRRSTDISFDPMACFLLWHALSTVGPYRCMPFQIMSNQLNLPQVDSNQVVQTSKNVQWEQDAPELNFESHSKASEYLCK